MSGRDKHLFEFTGTQIGEAARSKAGQAAYAAAECRSELEAAKAELAVAIEQAVESSCAGVLSGYFAGPRRSAAPENEAHIIQAPARDAYVFDLPEESWRRLLRAHDELGRANRDADDFAGAAARYGSQHGSVFELDAGDVAYFGLDQGGAAS